MLKRNVHTPAHLLLDDTVYFVTGAIYLKRLLLRDHQLKLRLKALIQTQLARYGWLLEAWVILDNHYHLICQSRLGKDLPTIIRNIHSQSASEILAHTACEKPVWWNYWDYCPRTDQERMTRLNYLLYNPVKHGYVTDLHAYPFSSFHEAYHTLGRATLASQFRTYTDYKTLTLHEAQDDDF